VSEHQEIRRRLAAIGKNRQWLARQLKKSDETVRQYLQPKGKRTKELMGDIERVIVLEEARQRENRADSPPWNVLFNTAEEFDLVDRASRLAKAESITEFCRGVLIRRSREIIEEKSRGSYPKGKLVPVEDTPVPKVADKPRKGGKSGP
jgi:hypothetical protein